MPSRALLQAATEADRCSLKQLGGQALRVQQTWEVAAREIATRKITKESCRSGNCHSEK